MLDLELRSPEALGGPGGPGGLHTNPEQLFAAGYAACFHASLRLAAAAGGVDVRGSAVTAKVGFGATGAGTFGPAVEMVVEIPDVAPAVADDLVARAHQLCPYSNAIRGNVEVTLSCRSCSSARARPGS